ncbi:hypothetical protein RSAG8_02455, partial [Rhizoctonia solani AG-8 WAC10335]
MCNNTNDPIPPSVCNKYNGLAISMAQQFGWDKAQTFQIDGTLLQLMHRDTIIHVGTGRGKTAVVAGPYVLDENRHKLTIFISPLMTLQSEMVFTFEKKYRVSAAVINSSIGATLTQIIKEILAKKYRILIISPESLLSHRVRDELLTNKQFKAMVLSIVIDEAQVISHWGCDFRKKYGSLHIIRDYLPSIPVVCLSATLTPRLIRDITSSLDMKYGNYSMINEGNERPELMLAARKCQYPMNSFQDLRFLLNSSISQPTQVPKTFIFIDSKQEGRDALKALNSFLPPNLSSLGIIRTFSARHSSKYRADTMNLFRIGVIRILICTDAAGMGCDIPDIHIVVQWRLATLSTIIQRWGRAARGPGNAGLCVLLAEPAAYTFNPTELESVPKEHLNTHKSRPQGSQLSKELLKKGGWKSKDPSAQPELRSDSPYEGALALVQTNGCLRKIWAEMYKNKPIKPLGPCCSSSMCNPMLLNCIQAPKPSRSSHSNKPKTPKRGVPHLPTQEILTNWRGEIWDRDHDGSTWDASGILSDSLIEFLSSIGSISTFGELERYLSYRWGWWDTYGEELADKICDLDIPYTTVPSKSRPLKRKAVELDSIPSPHTNFVPPTNRTAVLEAQDGMDIDPPIDPPRPESRVY